MKKPSYSKKPKPSKSKGAGLKEKLEEKKEMRKGSKK